MTHYIESFSFGGIAESLFRGIGSQIDNVASDLTRTVIKDTSGDLAKTVLRDSVEDIAKSGLKDSAESIGRNAIGDLSESGIKSLANDIGESGIKSAANDIGESGIKNLANDLSESGLKNLATDTAQSISKLSKFKTLTSFIRRNPKGFIIAGTSIVITATIAGIAGTQTNKLNNTVYTISSIRIYHQDSTKTIVYYTPNDIFAINDTVTISGTNSIPNIDDTYSISHIGPGTFVIDKTITSNGTIGTIRCQTNFSNQLVLVTTDAIKTVTAPVAQSAIDILSSTVKTAADSIGLPDIWKNFWWIILIIIILSIISCLSVFLFKFLD